MRLPRHAQLAATVVMLVSRRRARSLRRRPHAGAGPRVGLVHGSVAGSPPAAQPPDRSRRRTTIRLLRRIIRHHRPPVVPDAPGTQFVYRGSTLEGKERIHHSTKFTVTDLTKVIDGVRTIIVWDRDYSGGVLVETELAMFAQDTAGNIWHFGQYPEEYEGGRFVKAPAWVAGYEGQGRGSPSRPTRRSGRRATRRDMPRPPSTGPTAPGSTRRTNRRVCRSDATRTSWSPKSSRITSLAPSSSSSTRPASATSGSDGEAATRRNKRRLCSSSDPARAPTSR